MVCLNVELTVTIFGEMSLFHFNILVLPFLLTVTIFQFYFLSFSISLFLSPFCFTFFFTYSLFWLQAIANACKVPATSISELIESDVSEECETQFNEDQELEQLINGQICFKLYPFCSGMAKVFKRINLERVQAYN